VYVLIISILELAVEWFFLSLEYVFLKPGFSLESSQIISMQFEYGDVAAARECT
jgi:hypothetical protein